MKRNGLLKRLLVLPLSMVMVAALAPAAGAQGEPIEIDDQQLLTSTSEPFFVGGDYMWGLDQIRPPLDPATSPVSVTFDWGDGYADTVSSDQTYPDLPVWQGCEVESWRCWAWVGHTYAEQGLYGITLTVEQAGAASATYTGTAALYDVSAAASVKGVGTLTARNGGMYDQDFGLGLMSFQITARRRAGTPATSVSLRIDVPSMEPDYPEGSGVTGMTFSGTAATRPLYVQKGAVRGSYEIYLERVYGTVTKLMPDGSLVSAGTAYATLHVALARGEPTLARIDVWNTSAGYTYVSTGKAEQGMWDLDLENSLVSGSVKVG